MPTVDELPVAGAISNSDIFSLARASDGVLMRATVGDLLAGVVGGGSIGYTPVDKAGDTMLGALHMAANTIDGSAVAFTGGTVNGVVIGGTTRAAASFTTLAANGAVSLTASGTALAVTNNATIGGTFGLTGAMTIGAGGSGSQSITASGTGNFILKLGGTSSIFNMQGSGGSSIFRINSTSTPVNYVAINSANTGGQLFVAANGSDTNVNLVVQGQGTGRVRVGSSGTGGLDFGSSIQTSAVNMALVTSGVTGAMRQVMTLSGTVVGNTAGLSANQWNIASDTAAKPAGYPFWAHGFNYNFGGTGFGGNRGCMLLNVVQTGIVGDTANSGGMNVLQSALALNYSWGGTDTAAGAAGAATTFNPFVLLQAGFTNGIGGSCAEFNFGAATGATYQRFIGLNFVQVSSHAVRGTMGIDTAICFDNQGGAVGWHALMQVGSGSWPLTNTDSIFRCIYGSNDAGATPTKDGIDLRCADFVGNAYSSKGYYVSYAAQMRLRKFYATPVTNGIELTVDGQEAASATVAAGGTGWPHDGNTHYASDPYGGVWKLTVNGSGVVTAVTMLVASAVKGAAPSNPITITAMGRAKAWAPTTTTINITWAAATDMTVQGSAGKLGFFGATPTAKPSGVGVNITDVHAALVNLGLINASGEGSSPDPATTFADDFATLDVSEFGGAGVWAYASWFEPNQTDGYPINDSWAVVPTNVATPITSLYSVSAGALRLGIEETPALYAAACGDLPYVCGQIVANTFSQTYGYFEARIKAPHIIGSITAFWLMSNGPWPPEIDICEIITVAGGEQYPTATLWLSSTSIEQFNTYTGVDATQWHTYGVDWQNDFITFYIDRVQIGQYPTPSIYHDPMFPILTIENGDPDWTGPIPGGSTLSPAQFDYVKVWTEKPF